MREFKWRGIAYDSMPENRSIVIGSNERGDCTVLEWKHGCFFDGLTRVTNIVCWSYFPAPNIDQIRISWKN